MIERLPAGDDFVHVVGLRHRAHGGRGEHDPGVHRHAAVRRARSRRWARRSITRSDIYALGAITFFMLTGKPPFMGQNVMQVLRQHVEEPPPSVSKARPDMGVPDDMEVLVRRMLAKDPNFRPQSLSEVIHLLDKLSYATSDSSATYDGTASSVATVFAAPGSGHQDEPPPPPKPRQGTSPGLPSAREPAGDRGRAPAAGIQRWRRAAASDARRAEQRGLDRPARGDGAFLERRVAL